MLRGDFVGMKKVNTTARAVQYLDSLQFEHTHEYGVTKRIYVNIEEQQLAVTSKTSSAAETATLNNLNHL